MVAPDEAMQPTRAAVLTALIRIHNSDGRATVRGICDEVGISTSTCHTHLLTLRAEGLVAWEPETAGTLRPLVEVRGIA